MNAADVLYRRSSDLVAAILDAVYEDEEPIPWNDLVHAFTTHDTPRKTIENTIYDLVAFGALHRIGRPGDRRHPDTRAIRGTTLGAAWLAGQLPPPPPHRSTP